MLDLAPGLPSYVALHLQMGDAIPFLSYLCPQMQKLKRAKEAESTLYGVRYFKNGKSSRSKLFGEC